MADSIKFTIGGQLGPSYKGALSQAITEAQIANVRINRIMAATGSGHGGMRGSLVESIVVGREIGRNAGLGRIIGSLTLLAQRMGLLNFLFKDGTTVAEGVADAYATVAQRANANALALGRKAEMSAAAFMADASESEASLEQAMADETAAIAARQHATAMIAKAEAAQISAVASRGEAAATTMGLASMGTWAAAIAMVAYTLYERIWGVKKLLNELTFDTSKIEPKDDYIPLLKRHISEARNEQKALNDEIQKTVEHYFSAAEAAKRVSDSAKEHFDHLRKMNQESNLPQKEKDRRELEINSQERQEEISNKTIEQANLQIQGQNKLRQAAAIAVPTKEEDERNQAFWNQRKEEAEAFLKGGGFWTEFKKRSAITLGGASSKEIDETEAGGQASAQRIIAQANQYRDKTAGNEELRRQQSDLQKTGNAEIAQAVAIALALPGIKAAAKQKTADQAEELSAKPEQEKAGQHGKIALTEWERSGLFGRGGPGMISTDHIAVAKRQLNRLDEIAHNTHPSNSGAGQVQNLTRIVNGMQNMNFQ